MAKIYCFEKYKLKAKIAQLEQQILNALNESIFFDGSAFSMLRTELNDLSAKLIECEQNETKYDK